MFINTYIRAFRQIGPDKNVALMLVGANSVLAFSQFIEPILFGRVIDHLSGATLPGSSLWDSTLVTIVAAWIGFGLFTIIASVLVALHADRLSHRNRLAMIAAFLSTR